jgi:hypothetical protein
VQNCLELLVPFLLSRQLGSGPKNLGRRVDRDRDCVRGQPGRRVREGFEHRDMLGGGGPRKRG